MTQPRTSSSIREDRPSALRRSLLLAACAWLLLGTAAYGDFFKYVDEEGVETFTNTPTNSGAVKIMREAKPARAAKQAPRKENRETQRADESQAPGQAPVLPVRGIVTSSVGWRHDPIDGAIRHHNGVDIAVPAGTKVKAIAAGRVVESGPHGGYGNLVTVEHPDGSVSLYGHNSQLEVSAGDQVQGGQTLALSGSTGRSTGPHLHFELWKHGSNITETYLKTGAGIADVAGGIRTYLHQDGSIVFTNLN